MGEYNINKTGDKERYQCHTSCASFRIVLKFSTQYSKEGIALVTREKQALQATSDFPLALANANVSWRCGHETAYYRNGMKCEQL